MLLRLMVDYGYWHTDGYASDGRALSERMSISEDAATLMSDPAAEDQDTSPAGWWGIRVVQGGRDDWKRAVEAKAPNYPRGPRGVS